MDMLSSDVQRLAVMESSDFRRRVGARIRRAREAKGWTQTQLAQTMGVADAQVSRWETGRYLPVVPTLEQLAEVLEVPTEAFFRDD